MGTDKYKRILNTDMKPAASAAILFLIFLTGISSILRANVNYIDDMGRSIYGYRNFNFSRYLSDFLSVFIHGSRTLGDASPLPQIIAVLLMAVSGVLVIRLISDGRPPTLAGIIAVVPMGLSPYFLECFSYKFDTPYMGLSVLASVAPLFARKKRASAYIGLTALCMTAVCTTYQASLGIFPMLTVLLCLISWSRGDAWRETARLCITSAAGYLLGVLAFRFLIMEEVRTYVDSSLPGGRELIPTVMAHYRTYYSYIKRDFARSWLILAAVMGAGFIYVLVRDSRRGRLAAAAAGFAALTAMGLLAFGAYPFIQAPLYSPRAMYGFGCLIAFLGVFIAVSEKAFACKLACWILSWLFFVFSLIYGNALHVQDDYTNMRIEAVIHDINGLEALTAANGEPAQVRITGSAGWAPGVVNLFHTYPVLMRLIPLNFDDSWMWGYYKFVHYYGLPVQYAEQDFDALDLPVIRDTFYHTIRGDGRYILIELK